MQFFGFKEKLLISAFEADKNVVYSCPECRGPIKMRSGRKRTAHFYHLSCPKACTQHNKSAEHLLTQLSIYAAIPEGEGALELAFPSIQRIADVVWDKEKLIFEVQCSPITPEEIIARNKSYGSLGFEVIWILHDKRFNQRILSSAEELLRKGSCYFSSIRSDSKGVIYDQFEIIARSQRIVKGAPLPIDLVARGTLSQEPLELLPQRLRERISFSSSFFQGDLWDRCLKDPSLLKMIEHLEEMYAIPQKGWDCGVKVLHKGYRRLLLFLLRMTTSKNRPLA